MAKNKTTQTKVNVHDFIAAIADETKRKDAHLIIDIMKKHSGFEPAMWGPSIIGFGTYHYTYNSGHEGDTPLAGFSPRKTALVFYLSLNPNQRELLLPKLGKHSTGKGCIYVKKLADINVETLGEMVALSVENNAGKV